MTKKILVVSPNWLGDVVMAMPAVRRLLRERPGDSVSVLCRPAFACLWRAVAGVGGVVELAKEASATLGAGRLLRSLRFDEALILPNSFRSAVAPFLARTPRRRGTGSHARWLLVNDVVRFSAAEERLHQTLEYSKILCGTAECDFSDTGFRPSPDGAVEGLDRSPRPLVGIVPGAARGPSKRWPGFAEAARLVAEALPGVRFAVFGGKGEERDCEETAAAVGAANYCSRTNLAQFASSLAACDAVLCNDSGGMHLASAAGTPVVAVFGATDPEKTGPIGRGAVVVRAQGVKASRAVGREDPAAIAALRSVPPSAVAEAAIRVLRGGAG